MTVGFGKRPLFEQSSEETSLRDRSRETVQQETVAAIFVGDAARHHRVHNVIADQPAPRQYVSGPPP